jgi:methyl-accepting chemotaxis protein
MWIALAVVVAILVVGTAFLLVLRSEFGDAREDQLTLMELRRSALEDFLETMYSEVVLWSERPGLRDAALELQRAWDELPGDPAETLRRLYIDENPYPLGERHRLVTAGDGSLYSEVHERMHPAVLEFLDNMGYVDVFLFNPEGDLVYTASKEPDFATNFDAGPWTDTGLGRAFRAARDADSAQFVAFADFELYEPSNDEPSGFVASPIGTEDGGVAAVLAFQIPTSEIDEIMQFTGGMGNTGETYIIGEDLLMRSDSRFGEESTILRQAVDTEAAHRALAGETGVQWADDYRAVPSLAAFGPLDFEDVRWGVVAEIDRAELRRRAFEPRRLIGTILLGLAIVGALVSIVVVAVLNRAEIPQPWTAERTDT